MIAALLATVLGIGAGPVGLIGAGLGLAGTAFGHFFTDKVKWIAIAVGAVLVIGYIGALNFRIAHDATALALKDVDIAKLTGAVNLANQQRDEVASLNDRQAQQIDALTASAADFAARAKADAAALVRATAAADIITTNARKAIANAQTDADLQPSPALAAAYRSLRRDRAAPANSNPGSPGPASGVNRQAAIAGGP